MELPISLRARTHADATAIVAGGTRLTYLELESRAAALARRLAARGVGEGTRVATTLPPGPDFAALVHALPMLGAVLVPIDPRLGSAERRWRCRHVGTRLLVDEPPAGSEAEAGLRTSVPAGSTHSIIFTSGTTARARAVALSHGNHAASALAAAWALGVDPSDRWLCVLPVFHVGGLAILLRSALWGTAVVLHDRFDAGAIRSELESGRVTLVSLVPTMLRRLIAAGLGPAPALRAALLGGGPVPRDLLTWAAASGFPAVQTYGMTETASQIATLPAADALGGLGSAGWPLPTVRLRLGERGEVLVGGPMVAPDARAPDGWLHTGDRGRVDGRGRLHIEGRLADTIVTGGENVSPAQVEEALLEHPAVEDAGAVGEPDPEWGETVTALVVLSAEAGEAELIAHCQARLPGFACPKRIRRVDALPRNAAGKLVRREMLAG